MENVAPPKEHHNMNLMIILMAGASPLRVGPCEFEKAAFEACLHRENVAAHKGHHIMNLMIILMACASPLRVGPCEFENSAFEACLHMENVDSCDTARPAVSQPWSNANPQRIYSKT